MTGLAEAAAFRGEWDEVDRLGPSRAIEACAAEPRGPASCSSKPTPPSATARRPSVEYRTLQGARPLLPPHLRPPLGPVLRRPRPRPRRGVRAGPEGPASCARTSAPTRRSPGSAFKKGLRAEAESAIRKAALKRKPPTASISPPRRDDRPSRRRPRRGRGPPARGPRAEPLSWSRMARSTARTASDYNRLDCV